jgi:serine protease Do
MTSPTPPRSRRTFLTRLALASAALAACVALLPAQQSMTPVVREVNKKMVKLYGAGGFKGLPSYGTGILVSPDGYILTVNTYILNTADLRVHLYDGRVFHLAKVVYKEPELDVALIKIDGVDKLPHFDFAKAAAAPLAETGDWVLAFSNQFNIATRDEPMSVQRGVIEAYATLHGRRGIFEAPFGGEVYFTDAIANNPGAAGGILTNRRGELLGLIGRELKNTLTDTWINYAVPVQAKVEAVRDEKQKPVTVSLADFVREGMAGKWKTIVAVNKKNREVGDGYTGIILVPNAVSVTPPYVEEVVPGSPAAKAGLRPDDLIVYIDGELVPSIRQYREIVKYARPGAELIFEVQRGNRLTTVRLKLGEQPKVKAP